jgi:hypothetical protein
LAGGKAEAMDPTTTPAAQSVANGATKKLAKLKKLAKDFKLDERRTELVTDGDINVDINVDADRQCFRDSTTDEPGGGGSALRPVGHKADKGNFNRQGSSLAFQDNLRYLMVKKEEAESKARLMDADAKSRILETEAKVMAEENRIMLTDLYIISGPNQMALMEKKENIIRARKV